MARNTELQRKRQREWYQRMKQDPEWVERRKVENNLYKATHKEEMKKYNIEYTKKHPWIRVYVEIQKRCNDPENKDYKYYGARGIKNFLSSEDIKYLWFRDNAYLLKRPSIDRKDSKGHYDMDNCHFIEWFDNVTKSGYTSETGKVMGRLYGFKKGHKGVDRHGAKSV